MNLLVLSPLALENGRGGEISSMELASGLNKFHNVTIIDTNRFLGKKLLSRTDIHKKLVNVRKGKQIKFATLNILNKHFDFPYPQGIFDLYKQIKKNEIIYASIGNFKIDFLLMFFSLLHRNAKFIIGYRKPLSSEKFFSFYNIKYRLSILFFSFFKKKFIHHALSQHAKLFLNKFYEEKNVKHIVHGIELNKYSGFRSKKNRRDILKFVYIGFFDDAHKGVGVLTKAIDEFLENNEDYDIFFEFCGMGPLESNIKNLEEKYPKFVKYNGYVSNEEISTYYYRNDIYLFTSRREPFPRSIIEALAAKLIIICSKTIGSIELLKGQEFGFFLKELTPEAIIERINDLYILWKSNPERILELQELAKNFVFENYSIEIELKMFKELINKLCRSKL